MEYKELNSIKIPKLGFGVHHIQEGRFLIETVENAIKTGFRFLETAPGFFNEKGLGIGINNSIRKGIVERKDLFIGAKTHDEIYGYTDTIESFERSLEKYSVEYFDMYQIRFDLWNETRWQELLIDSWRALEELYTDGKIKVLGVSNMSEKYLSFLLEEAKIKPQINQIEIHPRYQQNKIQEYCLKNNILISSWGSLWYGKICNDEFLYEIAKKYNKTIAQIVLRWHIQKEHITVTRTTKPFRMEQNLNIFDFELSKEDIKTINEMDNTSKPAWPDNGIDK